MTPILTKYRAEYGRHAHLDATELRESAGYLAGLGTPEQGRIASPAQKRFTAISVQLIRAARLVEMAGKE